MSEEESLQIIRLRLYPAKISRMIVEFDPESKEKIVKVYLRDDQQLELALENNGQKARQAAMKSGMNVEICLASELPNSESTH